MYKNYIRILEICNTLITAILIGNISFIPIIQKSKAKKKHNIAYLKVHKLVCKILKVCFFKSEM